MKRLLPFVVLLLATGAIVGFIYKDRLGLYFQDGGIAEERAENPDGRPADRPVPILAGRAERADVPVYLYGVGTVRAFRKATVRAQVSGQLVSVEFEEGETVHKGRVLARIDPARYQAAYDQAMASKAINESALANAKADLARTEQLAKSNYTSEQTVEAQRAQVEQLEAQIRRDEAAVEAARTDLDDTVIRAPIDGRTGLREVDAGNLVTSADPDGIATISQLQPISVMFTLPETHIGALIKAREAGTVSLQASVAEQVVAEGKLAVIDNLIDQNTGTIRLKGTFPNDPLTLWPGQFVNVRLHLRTIQDATVVPVAALQQGAEGRYVYQIQPDETVALTPVKVTREDESRAVIAEGVQAGDQVALSGFTNLKDGAKVRVDDGSDAGAAPDAPTTSSPEGVSSSGDAPSKAETDDASYGDVKAAERVTDN